MQVQDVLLIKKLKDNYNDMEKFTDIVIEIEKKIENGSLPIQWAIVYDDYCKENKPRTDDFSYLDLGDKFIERIR